MNYKKHNSYINKVLSHKEDIINEYCNFYGEQYRYQIISNFEQIIFDIHSYPNDYYVYVDYLKEKAELCSEMEKEKILKEINSVSQHLEYFEKTLNHIIDSAMYEYIEKYKSVLLPTDQTIWEQTHNYCELEHLDYILCVDDCINYVEGLDYFDNNGYSLEEDNVKLFDCGIVYSRLYDKEEVNNKIQHFNKRIKTLEKLIIKTYSAKIKNVGNMVYCKNQIFKYEQILKQKEQYKKIEQTKNYLKSNCPINSLIKQMPNDIEQLSTKIMHKYRSLFLAYNQDISYCKNSFDNYDLLICPSHTTAFFTAIILDKVKKIKYKRYVNIYPAIIEGLGMDDTLIHEITHAMNFMVDKNDNMIYHGMIAAKVLNKNANMIEIFPREDYTNLEENFNEYIASCITDSLHKKGIYILEKPNEKISVTKYMCYTHTSRLVESFFNEHKQEYFASMFSLNMLSFIIKYKKELEHLANDIQLLSDYIDVCFEENSDMLKFEQNMTAKMNEIKYKYDIIDNKCYKKTKYLVLTKKEVRR